MFLKYSCSRFFSYCLFVALFVTQTLFAQGQATGGITGKVFDKSTKERLPFANVMVKGTNIGTACDLDGNYLLRNIPAGKRIIDVMYLGYVTISIELDIPAGRLLQQDFALVYTTIEGEEVVITAQAQGQVTAIQQQLTSDNIANYVSEAKIQQLPDFNAASALSRLPGVSTTQSSGEDNKVVIRGLSPQYNAIEIEGVRLSATGSSQIGLSSNPNSGSGGVNNDRSVDLTMVSPYMIRMIAVYKSLTPDMNANSIGGTVNMELREAPQDLHYELMYQQGYTAKSKTLSNYRTVASLSNRFFDNTLGIYGLVNAESYDRNSDNMSAGYNLAGEQVLIDPITGFRPVKVSSVSFNRHLETRERYGGNLILDYTIPHGSIKLVNMLARIKSIFTEHRQTINYDAGRMEWQLRDGENYTDQRMHSLKLDYDLGFINADLSISYTSSGNKLDKSPVINFNQVDALQSGVPRDNKVPEDLTYLLTKYKGDNNVVLRSADLFTNDYKESKYTYKADFEIPFNLSDDLGGFFKFGGQIYNQKNSTDQETPYLGFNGSATGSGTDIQSILMRGVKDRFGISTDALGNLIGTTFINSDSKLFDPFLDNTYGNIFYVSNPGLLKDILGYIVGNPAYDASNTQVSSGAQGGWYDGLYQKLTNDYKYKEDYSAAYGMAKINWWDFMIIGGVRYEKVETDYFAYNARDMRNAQQQKMYDTTAVKENEFFLPMAQIKYSPFSWMDVRYAYTQTLARPNFNSISPKFTITQGNTVYAGNPDLKPAQAFSHDLNFSFYSNKLGLFTVGGFYKTLRNFVYTATYQLDAAQRAGIDNIKNYTIVRDGQNVVIPQNNATIVKPYNNPFDATVKGLEFDFQHGLWYMPSPFNYLVFGINYARITSEAKYPFYDVKVVIVGRDRIATLVDSASTGRLIDQPNHVLNTYIGYDYEGFSTRISLVFQANRAIGNGGRYPENDAYTKDYVRLDFSARQKLPFYNMELFLDVTNLNGANTTSIHRSTQGFTGVQNYGLTANLGVRVRY